MNCELLELFVLTTGDLITKRFFFHTSLGLVLGAMLIGSSAKGTTVTFADGDTFDGDAAGSFAGPFDGYLIETVAVALDGVVNTTAAGLGINGVGADTADAFNNGQMDISTARYED